MDRLVTHEDKEILKKIARAFLKDIFAYIKDLPSDWSDNLLGDSLYISYRTWYELTKGSPEEGSHTGTYPNTYVISSEVLRQVFQLKLKEKQWLDRFAVLEKIGIFKMNEFHLLNPTFSIFGFLISRCLQTLTETTKKELTFNEISFNEELFSQTFNDILQFLIDDEIEIECYYIIWGLNIQGDDFLYDVSHDKWFIVPTNEKRAQLSKSLRLQYSDYWGQAYVHDRLSWTMSCNAWISGKVRLKKPSDKFPQSIEEHLLKEVDLFPPSYLQEALNLLGFETARVEFFSITNENVYGDYRLYPMSKGVSWGHSSVGSLQYPEWMSRSSYTMFHSKPPIFVSNDHAIRFLQMYPAFRSQLKPNSHEVMIINRFSRIMHYTDWNDIIVEAIVIFESILTEDITELSYQLRIKMAQLLCQNLEERQFIHDLLKDLYRIRSIIVHKGGIGIEKDKTTKKLGGLSLAASMTKDLVRLTILRLLYLKANTLHFIPHKEIAKKLTKIMLGGNLMITNSTYYDLLAPEIIKTIQDKFAQAPSDKLLKI